jgi:hypothetical protein
MAVIAVRSARGALLCAVLPLLVLFAACGSGRPGAGNASTPATSTPATSTPATSTPPSSPSTSPAECRSCQPRQSAPLASGAEVRLWLSTDHQDYRSRPVVELLVAGRAVQSWAAPQGDGWNGTLTCRDGVTPNCVLIDSVGMHASIAELLIVQDGRLIHPPNAEVTADSPGMKAADLDHDDYLDVIGTTNDYSPNYAQGHNFWQTFRYADGEFVATGCARQVGIPAPTRLLSGTCPPQG